LGNHPQIETPKFDRLKFCCRANLNFSATLCKQEDTKYHGFMMMHKAFRFRIYPDDHACQTLAGWFGCVRLVGNLAKEQRRMFSRKDRNITYAMQCAELPAMRAEFQ